MERKLPAEWETPPPAGSESQVVWDYLCSMAAIMKRPQLGGESCPAPATSGTGAGAVGEDSYVSVAWALKVLVGHAGV